MVARFVLGQRIRIKAEAMVAYDYHWFRLPRLDAHGSERISEPANWAEDGWECVHQPKGDPRHATFRRLWRLPFQKALDGVVVGRTYRATGCYWPGDTYADEGDPPYLNEDKRHTLYEVAVSLRVTDRFLVLPEDIEEDNDAQS